MELIYTAYDRDHHLKSKPLLEMIRSYVVEKRNCMLPEMKVKTPHVQSSHIRCLL